MTSIPFSYEPYKDVEFLAKNEPPFDRVGRLLIKIGQRVSCVSCNNDILQLQDYEAGLRIHKEALLSREDTLSEVRNYIRKHII